MKEQPLPSLRLTRREKREPQLVPERVSGTYLQEQLTGPIDERPSLPAKSVLAERQGCKCGEDAPAPLFIP